MGLQILQWKLIHEVETFQVVRLTMQFRETGQLSVIVVPPTGRCGDPRGRDKLTCVLTLVREGRGGKQGRAGPVSPL